MKNSRRHSGVHSEGMLVLMAIGGDGRIRLLAWRGGTEPMKSENMAANFALQQALGNIAPVER
jgi:hypothetical protein